MVEKEIGYHAFNLCAFAILNEIFPDHPFWKTRKFFSILDYINSIEFMKGVVTNRFAYPYNPPGFEIGYALQVFRKTNSETEQSIRWWLNQQLIHSYDKNLNLLNMNTEDKHTLAARFYEVTRLHDLPI
jgi:hypothetical protein